MAKGTSVTGKAIDLMAALKESLARLSLADLTKEERSLLLFFEANAVDHGGALNTQHMNDADRAIAARWHEEKFIEFGRIAMASLQATVAASGHRRTHYVVLGPEALALAQEERRARIERMAKDRTWRKARE
jgi:hypothetical protein